MITIKPMNIERKLFLGGKSIVKVTGINKEYWSLPGGMYCFLSNKQTLSLSLGKDVKVDANNFMGLRGLQLYIELLDGFIS